MTVFDELVAPVLPILETIEHTRRKHGNETFRWITFVRILIFYFTERCGSRNALIQALEDADPALNLPAIPAMTLTDAFHRFDPQVLQTALRQLMMQVDRPVLPELALIGDIHAVDGSYFPIMGGLTPQLTKDVSHLKLHLDFDLGRLIATDFIVDTPQSSERQALRAMWKEHVTYVIDRGYMAFGVLRDAIEAHAHVVMRAYTNIVVETCEDLPIHLPSQLATHWSAVTDRHVRSNHEDVKGIIFRVVEFTIGTSKYTLITDRSDLTTFQVILFYAYRWQIELIFRYFKHTINGVHVMTQQKRGIEQYFAAMFLTALLHIQFKTTCLQSEGYQVATHETIPETGHTHGVGGVAAQQQQKIVRPRQRRTVPISQDTTRPSADQQISAFLAGINVSTVLFWKIPKHWLTSLATQLYRPFTPDVVQRLNKRALADFKIE